MTMEAQERRLTTPKFTTCKNFTSHLKLHDFALLISHFRQPVLKLTSDS